MSGPKPLPAGSTVASHYVFFDPGPTLSIRRHRRFRLRRSGDRHQHGNSATGDFPANTGVNYLNPTFRGLDPRDSVTISGSRQIAFKPGDYVRVLTVFSPHAMPEPSSIFLLGTGLAGLPALAYSRNRVRQRA